MALDGLLALTCAATLVTADPSASAAPSPAGRESGVTAALAVQTALQQGREHIHRRDYRAAVYILESQIRNLSSLSSNRVYLATLQDAYREYIKELVLAKQEATAQLYLTRLRILDPGAVLDFSLSAPAAATPKPAVPAPAKPTATIRLKGEDKESDPFDKTRAVAAVSRPAADLLARAEQEFSNRHYRESQALFEQAHKANQTVSDAGRERWAYCKLYCVVEQINETPSGSLPWSELEREVRAALELAPKLDYAKQLLQEMENRRRGLSAAETPHSEPAVPVRHLSRSAEGWEVAETTNFRLFHTLSQSQAEQVAQVAERTRSDMLRKWFGGGEAWRPKCDVFLHATAKDYSRVTGVPGNSPGHSSISMEGGRLLARCIHLHCDDPNLLRAVLPHETTHVVLAGQFGDQPVPRWVDEGIAVLTEPRDKVERHLQNLAKCRQSNQLFRPRELMEQSYQPQQDGYPEPRRIAAFYAQSVSLVEFLTSQRGPQAFTAFVREGQRSGYEAALQRYYNYRSFQELEQNWSRLAFSGEATTLRVAERSR